MFCSCEEEEASGRGSLGGRSGTVGGNPTLLSGWLLRKGRWRWTRRKVVLRRDRLEYSSAGMFAPAVVVDLAGASVEDVDEAGRNDLAVIASNGASHRFRCASHGEKARWLRAVGSALAPETGDRGDARGPEAPRPRRPVVHGVMLKKGQALWNRRYFVVVDRVLEWADEGSNDRAGGRVLLEDAAVDATEADLTIVVRPARHRAFHSSPAPLRVKCVDGPSFEKWARVLAAVAAREVPRAEVKALWQGADGPKKATAVPYEGDVHGLKATAVVVLLSLFAVLDLRRLLAIVFPILRYAVVPAVVLLANVWYFRQNILVVVRSYLNARWHVSLKRTPALDAEVGRDASGRVQSLDLVLRSVVLEDPTTQPPLDEEDADDEDDDDEEEPLAALRELRVSLSVPQVGKSRRRRLEISAAVNGLVITYTGYDARFRDTNLSRLLDKINGGGDGDDADGEEADAVGRPAAQVQVVAGEPPATPAAAEEPPTAAKPARPPPLRKWVFRNATVNKVDVRLRVVGPFGARRLGSVCLDDESVDVKKLSSLPSLLLTIQGLALRAIANLSFDAVEAVFLGGTGVATGVAFIPLDAIDTVAERLGGSKVIQGVTGGVRGVVGGVVTGGAAVVGGVGTAGRSIVQGVTSGTATGAAHGFVNAGSAVVGGVVHGVENIAHGVYDGGAAVATGVAGGAHDTAQAASHAFD